MKYFLLLCLILGLTAYTVKAEEESKFLKSIEFEK